MIWLNPLSAVISGKPFTIAEAAIIASGNFVLYFLRSSIVFSFISLDKVISLQSLKSDFILYSSELVILNKIKVPFLKLLNKTTLYPSKLSYTNCHWVNKSVHLYRLQNYFHSFLISFWMESPSFWKLTVPKYFDKFLFLLDLPERVYLYKTNWM